MYVCMLNSCSPTVTSREALIIEHVIVFLVKYVTLL